MRILFLTIALISALMTNTSAQAQHDPPGQANVPLDKGLLIIVPSALRTSMLDYYVFKARQRSTMLVTLESVLESSGGADDAEKLKRYIYTQWRTRHIQYVLLVGDVDVMPVRYMALDRITPNAFDYAFYATDLYYADLADAERRFDDWNAQHDGFHARYIGEVRGEKNKSDPINFDHVDFHPDVAVGRWPVSTPEEVKNMVAKSMAYEKAMNQNTKPGSQTAAFIASPGWVDGRNLFDSLAAHLPKSWSVEKRYFSDDQANHNTPPPDTNEVKSLLNSGVEVMVHIGHGDNNSWNGCFSVNDLPALNNADRLPIMMSAGCSTAVCTAQAPYEAYTDADGAEHKGTNGGEIFTAPPPPPACYQHGAKNASSLGEQLLRAGPNGAVVYIGCNTGGQPCALTLIEGFMNAIAEHEHGHEHECIGDCWIAAINHYYDKENLDSIKPDKDWYPPSVFYQPMKYMFFGDPSLSISPAEKASHAD